tara:strand:- start:2035 stop:2523 length:489 start_codon:yes stop_codon:yes gene_type:complete
MSKQPKRKNNGEGTAVGNALRFLAKQGKKFAPDLLTMAGQLTGVTAIEKLGNAIRGDAALSETDKQLLIQELEVDMAREQEVTKRWQADLNSDSWLAKNVRPIVLFFLMFCMFLFIILDSTAAIPFSIHTGWVDLLESLMITAVGGYFVVRSGEKISSKFKK